MWAGSTPVFSGTHIPPPCVSCILTSILVYAAACLTSATVVVLADWDGPNGMSRGLPATVLTVITTGLIGIGGISDDCPSLKHQRHDHLSSHHCGPSPRGHSHQPHVHKFLGHRSPSFDGLFVFVDLPCFPLLSSPTISILPSSCLKTHRHVPFYPLSFIALDPIPWSPPSHLLSSLHK